MYRVFDPETNRYQLRMFLVDMNFIITTNTISQNIGCFLQFGTLQVAVSKIYIYI